MVRKAASFSEGKFKSRPRAAGAVFRAALFAQCSSLPDLIHPFIRSIVPPSTCAAFDTGVHAPNLSDIARQIKPSNRPRDVFPSAPLLPAPCSLSDIGGGGGIRTHGPFQVSSFQDWRNRPLYHPSGTRRIQRPPQNRLQANYPDSRSSPTLRFANGRLSSRLMMTTLPEVFIRAPPSESSHCSGQV